MATTEERQELQRLSTPELLDRLSKQVTLLFHQEIHLAKAEMMRRLRTLGAGAAAGAVAAGLGIAAFGTLIATVVLAIDVALPAWAAALIVTAALGLLAAILALVAYKSIRRASPPIPQLTIESVKEDVEWLTNRKRSSAE